jgi:hypothetical protein
MGGQCPIELAHRRLEVASGSGQEAADPGADGARPGIIPSFDPSGYGFRISGAIYREQGVDLIILAADQPCIASMVAAGAETVEVTVGSCRISRR